MCAVADGQVHRLASAVEAAPRVVSLGARDLEGIWTDVRTVGSALDLEDEAEELVAGLASRIAALRPPATSGTTSRVLCIEWLDPLYIAGHWVPELVNRRRRQRRGGAARQPFGQGQLEGARGCS